MMGYCETTTKDSVCLFFLQGENGLHRKIPRKKGDLNHDEFGRALPEQNFCVKSDHSGLFVEELESSRDEIFLF